MKYLLFEYGESPISVADNLKVKYSYDQNLNILDSTNKPAVNSLNSSITGTSTKVDNEVPDTDSDYSASLATQTHTLVDQEQTDSDDDFNRMEMSMITMTTTKVEMESTDDD